MPTNLSTTHAIHASGQIAGEQTEPDSVACIWNGTVPAALPSIGNGGWSEALAINASGQIAGCARALDGSAGSHAMLWSGNGAARVATDLGTLGGGNSGACGINAAALVVGYAETVGQVRHAALWTTTMVVDLNTALSPAEAVYVTLTLASAINDQGWIVASHNHQTSELWWYHDKRHLQFANGCL